MEQTPSSPGRSPELPSVALPPTGEVGTFSQPEVVTGTAIEQEGHREGAPNAGQSTAMPPVATPDPIVAAQPSGNAAVTSTAVANDDELIEKEWVNKAKKVIAETKDDPYRREQEVNRLQADYLSKRYGRELGGLRSEG